MADGQVDEKLIARYIMQYQKDDENLVRYQLDTNKDIEKFKYDLLGFKFDKSQGKWVKDDKKMAICNEKGANAIASFLDMHINRIVSLSDFQDDEEIMKTSFYDIKSFVYFLVFHMEEFEFVSYPAISMVLSTIDKINVSTMKKAREAGERDSLRKTFVHNESTETVYNPNQPKPQGKWFGGLFGGRQ